MPQLSELVEETSRRGLRPRRLAADKGYDYPNIHEYLQEKNVGPCIPERASAKKEAGFTYDGERDCMVCTQGKVSIGKTERQSGSYIY